MAYPDKNSNSIIYFDKILDGIGKNIDRQICAEPNH